MDPSAKKGILKGTGSSGQKDRPGGTSGKKVRFSVDMVAEVPAPKFVASLLKCCIKCNKVLSPGSYTCTKGHTTCFECAHLNMKCCFVEENSPSACGEGLSRVPCHAYESMFSAATIKCPIDQCGMRIRGHEIGTHKFQCVGRTSVKTKCFFSMCLHGERTVYKKQALLDHLVSAHWVPQYEIKDGMISQNINDRNTCFSGRIGFWKVGFVLTYSKDARFMCTYGREIVDGRESLVFVLYHIFTGSETSTEQTYYHGTILFYGGRGKRFTNKRYSGLLPNILATKEDVLGSYRCLVVPYDLNMPIEGCVTVKISGAMDEDI